MKVAVSDGFQNPGYQRNLEMLAAVQALDPDCARVSTGVAAWDSLRSLPRFVFQCLRFAFSGRVDADVVFVLLPDYASVPALFLHRLFQRKNFRIVYDPFISQYDTYVYNKPLPWRPFKKTILRLIDKMAFSAADVVLMDTDLHADYLSELLRVPRTKFRKVLVGYNRDVFGDAPAPADFWERKPLRVLWYGKPSGVHGLDALLDAVSLTPPEVSYTLVSTRARCDMDKVRALEASGRVDFIEWDEGTKTSLEYWRYLRALAAAHHVCLGGFGGTRKAASVVMNKEYEALAAGRALVTRSGRREFLEDGVNCFQVPPHDAKALADCLSALSRDRAALRRVAEQGRKDVEEAFPAGYTRRRLSALLAEFAPSRIETRARPLEDVRIAVSMAVRDTPWGGANQFIASFKEYFQRQGAVVSSRLDGPADLIVLIDPRTWTGTFTHREIERFKRKNPAVKVLHRVNECDARKGTKEMDDLLREANRCADHTVFIAEWLRDYFAAKWFDRARPHTCIRNGADERVFHPKGHVDWDGTGPLRVVTHHWGDHWLKGFDIYTEFDRLLADPAMREKYHFTVVGRWPKGVEFKHSATVAPLNGVPLADELRKHHVYLTASRWEPCGMHHIEGANCGLPVLYIDEGGGIVECCRGFGLEFTKNNFPEKLEQMRTEYAAHALSLRNYGLTAANCMKRFESVVLRMLGR